MKHENAIQCLQVMKGAECINALSQEFPEHYGIENIEALELAIEVLKKNRWTPCSLMLPKKHEHVLATWKCGEYYHTTEAVYEDNGWLHYCPKPLPSDIEFIAWMPLPPAYKEGE